MFPFVVHDVSWVVMHNSTRTAPWPMWIGSAPTLGHDATYGTTTHAPHVYYPESVKPRHRFVDVISQLDDGRMMIDYSKVHDTEPG